MITQHTYSVDAADPAHLERRLSYLERALTLRGGKLTSIKRRVHRSGRPQAIVRYEVPDLSRGTGAPSHTHARYRGDAAGRPSTFNETR